MSQNKRGFYRLNVMIPLSYRILTEEEAQAEPLPKDEATSGYIEHHFLDTLQKIEQQLHEAVEKIATKSDLLASALHALNSKINMAMQTIDKRQLAHLMPLRRVNISGGGLAFITEESVQPTDKIDLLMQPLPDEEPILVRSHIVNIQPAPEKGPKAKRVAVEFENLTENDRRKLIFFIQKKELEQAQIEKAKQK
ncbi:PilZ domain-containing protein [Alcanivorax sp.]|uniref:PilZ domain-containing protein n=1 Tax=Alcanivorax sp. TaxID=1872427 RepID=UPI00258ADA87|nr:PilZ domain-containing protein [Alcanivorax sp.]